MGSNASGSRPYLLDPLFLHRPYIVTNQWRHSLNKPSGLSLLSESLIHQNAYLTEMVEEELHTWKSTKVIIALTAIVEIQL